MEWIAHMKQDCRSERYISLRSLILKNWGGNHRFNHCLKTRNWLNQKPAGPADLKPYLSQVSYFNSMLPRDVRGITRAGRVSKAPSLQIIQKKNEWMNEWKKDAKANILTKRIQLGILSIKKMLPAKAIPGLFIRISFWKLIGLERSWLKF